MITNVLPPFFWFTVYIHIIFIERSDRKRIKSAGWLWTLLVFAARNSMVISVDLNEPSVLLLL